MTIQPVLPAGVHMFERGWLSSNNVLLIGSDTAVLVDSGYCTHASQTLSLIENKLDGKQLDVLVNTHLHSDHCGGNAALQQKYENLQTHIPPGMSEHVLNWDACKLTYTPTGQSCPPFRYDALLMPGSVMILGDLTWEVHAAPGHDPHSMILFEPRSRLLISADALWENGFGVVFPELEGLDAFDQVAATLDLIESLQPRIVIPGHGRFFSDTAAALKAARRRLKSFQEQPLKHAQYAAKVLLKFKLLELQRMEFSDLEKWVAQTPYLELLHETHFSDLKMAAWVKQLADELIRSGAAEKNQHMLLNR